MPVARCWTVPAVTLLLLLPLLLGPGRAEGQEKYPVKPLTYVVGYPPGGGSDISSRALATAAARLLGQPVVVVNKPGGASSVALAGLKNEKPDGYTIGLLPTGPIIAQHMRKLSYDSARDFTPILQFAELQMGLVVRTDGPWASLKELAEYARANPGKIRYSTAGPGSPPHLVMEQVGLKEKIKWTHIPFEGTAPAIAALLGGHVEANADSTFWKPHVEAGRLRLLVGFGEKRISFLPQVPTLMELGYGVTGVSLLGVIGPKGLSPQVVETLHDAFRKAMDDPEFARAMQQMDILAVYRSSQDFARHLVKVNEELEALIRGLGLRKE
ncbi:MAG: tripartite tricarboxylate transporter substrate binding protein [Candidatus Rokubacteria bacterium]|nr:tripartite tricarboxylate transporter substrate binding protein [Candidatus Rokubacteria bacterium]